MPVGRVQGLSCEPWERGLDCKFSEWWYYVVVALLWLLTAMPFLQKILPCKAHGPSGSSRLCLLLTACSALLNSLDALLFLVFGIREKRSDEYGLGTLSNLGSILLMFALRLFAYLWCDVTGALSKLQKQDPNIAMARRFAFIRRGYDAVAFGHIPFALLMSCADYEWGPDFDQAIMIYMAWCSVSLFIGFTGLALAMWCIAREIPSSTRTGNLVKVTGINLGEQMLYDLCLILSGSIYQTAAYRKFGFFQAVNYTLMFLLSWLLHAQVLVFFCVCDVNDPLYSQEDLDALLLESSASSCSPNAEIELGATIGNTSTTI